MKYSRHKNKDRLDPIKQQRYDELLAHIDSNLNLILQEKQEYHKNIDHQSQVSRVTMQSELYYGEDDKQKISLIN